MSWLAVILGAEDEEVASFEVEVGTLFVDLPVQSSPSSILDEGALGSAAALTFEVVRFHLVVEESRLMSLAHGHDVAVFRRRR